MQRIAPCLGKHLMKSEGLGNEVLRERLAIAVVCDTDHIIQA